MRCPEAAKHGSPRKRSDDRLHAHEAKSLRLHLPPQSLGGPTAKVAGMRVIKPAPMRRQKEPPVRTKHAPGFMKIAGDVPDVLEHLERGYDVELRVAAGKRSVGADRHLVAAVDIGASIPGARCDEPALVGPGAAAEIQHLRRTEAKCRVGK